MNKLIKLIRGNSWWAYKIPPILAVAFMIVLNSSYTIVDLYYDFIIVIISLVVGAAYVSFINDATDIEEDLVAGKPNGMTSLSVPIRVLLVLLPLAIATIFIVLYFESLIITTIFYVTSFVIFTLYSVPPFRLKERGFAGVFADALGSQALPTMFAASFFISKTHQQMNLLPLFSIGCWSLCFGLRCIIWHQFADLKNDLKSGLRTIAGKMTDRQTRFLGYLILFLELISLLYIMYYYHIYSIAVGFLIYAVYIYLIKTRWNVVAIFIKPPNQPYRIFMSEFYQVYLPICILVQCAVKNLADIVALIIHLILFPIIIVRMIKDWIKLLRK